MPGSRHLKSRPLDHLVPLPQPPTAIAQAKVTERTNLLERVDRTEGPDHKPPATLDQILRHAEARRHPKAAPRTAS